MKLLQPGGTYTVEMTEWDVELFNRQCWSVKLVPQAVWFRFTYGANWECVESNAPPEYPEEMGDYAQEWAAMRGVNS